MSITKKYLEDLGLTEEQVNSIFAERGKEIETDKQKIEKLQSDLKEKDVTINDLTEKAKNLDGTEETVKQLKEQVATYEKAETERQELENQKQIDADLKNRFTSVLGEQKFKHEDIETGRFNAFKSALADEKYKGKGDADVFADVIKDMDCFVNPQQAHVEMPSGSSNGNTDTLTKAREIMGLSKEK